MKPIKIFFIDEKAFQKYSKLSQGKHEEKQVQKWLDKAITEFKQDNIKQVQIPHKQVPKEYNRKYSLKGVAYNMDV